MIFIGLLIIFALGYVFCMFWGMVFGGLAAWQSNKWKKFHAEQALKEPPSHVTLLTPPTPYDRAEDLEGWDGAEELDVEEEDL